MTTNAEKLLSMLTMEAIKVRESGDLKEIEDLYLEVQRFIKTEYSKLEATREQLYIEALNGQEEGQINGWQVSYRPIERFALDAQKLKAYFAGEGYTEEEMKNLIYSHSQTKPSLKFKTLKN